MAAATTAKTGSSTGSVRQVMIRSVIRLVISAGRESRAGWRSSTGMPATSSSSTLEVMISKKRGTMLT